MDTWPFHLEAGAYGRDALRVREFRGTEQVSEPYSFHIRVEAPQADVATFQRTILGAAARLTFATSDGDVRRVHGVVRKVEATRVSGGDDVTLWLAPRLWTLKRRVNTRIFQDKTVADIVAAVLDEAGVDHEAKLANAHAPRPYCVQYQESDLAFVERILAEEGIFYFFEDPPAGSPLSRQERVVLADSASYAAIPGGEELPFRPEAGMHAPEDHIERFALRSDLRSNSVLARHFEFTNPSLNPSSKERHAEADGPQLGVYTYHFDTIEKQRAVAVAGTQLEQARARQQVGSGATSCRRLVPGMKFRQVEHPVAELNRDYVVLCSEHEGFGPRGASEEMPTYRNTFSCLPSDTPARPRRKRRKLKQVMETAVVVGPEGEEIFTDEHGRIKVQFHWDQQGERNEHSSCFLRVMQPWAGAAYGHLFIPRVGMEVVVTFTGGDVDKPLALGCVYNGASPPPHVLPQHQTRSGIRTQSSPGGNGSNEIMFEDKAGEEQLFIHAQRDMAEVVEHDRTREVKNDETVHVVGSRDVTIDKSNARSVGGNETVVVEGNRMLHVMGNQLVMVDGQGGQAGAGAAAPGMDPAADAAAAAQRAFLDSAISFRASQLARELDPQAQEIIDTAAKLVEQGLQIYQAVTALEQLASAGDTAQPDLAAGVGAIVQQCGGHAKNVGATMVDLASQDDPRLEPLRAAVGARLHRELVDVGSIGQRAQRTLRPQPAGDSAFAEVAPAADGMIRGEGQGGGGADPEVITDGSSTIISGGASVISPDGHSTIVGGALVHLSPGQAIVVAPTVIVVGATVNIVGGAVNIKGGKIELN
jgi:type VI secretion system secreted protein VgrG